VDSTDETRQSLQLKKLSGSKSTDHLRKIGKVEPGQIWQAQKAKDWDWLAKHPDAYPNKRTVKEIEDSVLQEVSEMRDIKKASEGRDPKDLAWNIACVEMNDTDGFYENARNSHMEHFYSNSNEHSRDEAKAINDNTKDVVKDKEKKK